MNQTRPKAQAMKIVAKKKIIVVQGVDPVVEVALGMAQEMVLALVVVLDRGLGPEAALKIKLLFWN